MKTLKNRLAEGLKNIYIVSGEDSSLADKAYSMILVAAGIGRGFELFDIVMFTDENYSAQAVTDSCECLPMGPWKRVVLVKNISRPGEIERFESYAKNPAESTCLVILDSFDVFGFLKAEHVNCKRLSDEDLIKIIAVELKKYNKVINHQAALELAGRCNFYFGKIMNEVKKLSFLCYDSPVITMEMVEESVTKEAEFVIFELTDALGTKNAGRSITLLQLMEKDPGTFSLIVGHFRRMFFAGISEGTNAEIAKELGVKEYAVTKAKMAAKNFSKVGLKRIFELLEETDYMVKSGAMSQINALYYLVFNVLIM